MKQIAFVSGKGGTGKSTLVSSLCIIAKDKLIADCDVDAPDLHILLCGMKIKQKDFYGSKIAVIDREKCNECGACLDTCQFDAVKLRDKILIDGLKCEGCGACGLVCPQKAIDLINKKTGITTLSRTKMGFFSHALLNIGAEGSGKLVTRVRQYACDNIFMEKWVLIDGSPGIGCVVIASVVDTDAVVIVTEPTLSGMSDLKRIYKLVEHFGITAFVCINKYNLNEKISRYIENYCREEKIFVIGKVPFDRRVISALQEFKTPVEVDCGEASKEIKNIWLRLITYFDNKEKERSACV